MNLSRFKILHEKFKNLPLSKEEWDTPEYEEYCDAIHDDKACGEYYLEKQLKDKNFPYKYYCCLEMAYHLAFPGNRDDIDQIINHFTEAKEFGIPIHDSGSSHIKINFCPWCGTKLDVTSETTAV